MLNGDVLLLAAVMLPVAAWVYAEVSNRLGAKRSREAVRAAQGIEIGDGVTLGRGIRAYFGEEGFWLSPYTGCVTVMAGDSDPSACLSVNVETGQVEVESFRRGGSPEDGEGRAALIGLMVAAAKRQDGLPGR